MLMLTPSQVVFAAHGSPVVDGCALDIGGVCYLCAGRIARGAQLVSDWMGPGFTGQTLARSPSSVHICEACCYVTSRVSPVLGREAKEGKKFGGCFRNYSNCSDEFGYFNASKGEKPLLRAFLARGHSATWFAGIADSGQKHVLPFCRMNGPGRRGVVLFDEQSVVVPDDQCLLGDAMALLTAGATKEEIESGNYGPRAWQLCGDALPAFELAHSSERHGAWFGLAIWLAQRDEETVAARICAEKDAKNVRGKTERKSAEPDRRSGARAKSSVSRNPEQQQSEALGHPARPDASGSQDKREPRGVGDGDGAKAPARNPEQLRLFGSS